MAVKTFIKISGVLLFATSIAKLISVFGNAGILQTHDPVLDLQFNKLLLATGVVEMAVTVICIFGKSHSLSLVLIAWLATGFLAYRLGLWWVGWPRLCPCLGNLTDGIRVPPRIANDFMVVMLVYFLIGSYGAILGAYKRDQKSPHQFVHKCSYKKINDYSIMRSEWHYGLWFIVIIFVSWILFYHSDKTQNDFGSPIYNETADAPEQIANALILARAEHKLILLQFGANWCFWCHQLDNLLQANKAIRKEIQIHYIIVLVDVDNGHNQATVQKYNVPTQDGIPALVILAPSGKPIVTQNVRDLAENGKYSSSKILSFLTRWTTGGYY